MRHKKQRRLQIQGSTGTSKDLYATKTYGKKVERSEPIDDTINY